MRRIIAVSLSFILTLSAFAQQSDRLDDIFRVVPLASVYALKATGIEGASSWMRLGANSIASMGLCCGTTLMLKEMIHKDRPDMSDDRSFPSGHASVAFASAHMLHKEYGRISPWISVGGYTVAAFTAIDRIARQRHDWYDVTVGTVIGIASVELGYWIGDMITGECSRFSVSVTPGGLAMIMRM